MANLQIDDTVLMAYADGELDLAVKRQVESVMASDRAVLERVQMCRQSSILLRAAFAESDDHELSPKLLNTVHAILNDRSRRSGVRLTLLAAAAAVIAAFAIGVLAGPKYFAF
jgi:anti-sigma factor RsiW